ncbi:MAG: RNA polymerase sigma factor RpoD [Chloroflexi bacterium OHK40]
MSPDPFTNPLAALTSHPVLSHEVEAALIATMRAGFAARATLLANEPAAAHQVAAGEEARATLARHNLRLVVNLARRYQHVAGEHLSLEDLIGFGTIGLLQAIDRFDPRKANKLSTYATWWVRQAITRGIMDEGRLIALPIHLHERLAVKRRVSSRLTQQLGREPTPEELGAALGWSRAKTASVTADLQDAGSLNVRMGVDADSSEVGELLPDTRFDPEGHALEGAFQADVREAMARLLTERERQFVHAHFGFGTGQKLTLDVIGQQAGLTRERVRQVIVGALDKLRDDPVIQAYGASLLDE